MKTTSTERMRKWRNANREKFNAYMKQYHRDHPECWKSYYLKNRDKLMARSKKWYWDNKDDISRKYKAWYQENSEEMRKRTLKWQKENPSTVNANCRRYYAQKLNAVPKWAHDFFIKEIYRLAKLRTKILGYEWHVDHIVPLRSKLVCGLHVENNLQVIPAHQNRVKKNVYWPEMP